MGRVDNVIIRGNIVTVRGRAFTNFFRPTTLRIRLTVKYVQDSSQFTGDINRDGALNILDLEAVASHFGKYSVKNPADVNGDDVVNILDLVLVAGVLGRDAAAPVVHPQ